MKKLNHKGFAPLIVIVIVVATLAVGGYIYWHTTKTVESPTPTTTSVITSFNIEPSHKEDGWTYYDDGAKAILKGSGFVKVEIKYLPTGTGTNEAYPEGKSLGITTYESSDTWTLSMPKKLLATNFYAEATDTTGAKIKSSDLGNVGYQSEGQPVINPVPGWKTYTNTKYGYEFKYPADVSIQTMISAKFGRPANGNDDNLYIGGLIDITMVNSLGKCSDLRTEQAIRTCLGSVSWAQQDHWIPITIGGLPAVRREITLKPTLVIGSDIAPVGYIYYVSNGSIGFQISFADSIIRRPVMEQLLSTFKFIGELASPIFILNKNCGSFCAPSDCGTGYHWKPNGYSAGETTKGSCEPN